MSLQKLQLAWQRPELNQHVCKQIFALFSHPLGKVFHEISTVVFYISAAQIVSTLKHR